MVFGLDAQSLDLETEKDEFSGGNAVFLWENAQLSRWRFIFRR